MGVVLRKRVLFTVKGCFRSVCNHPFLVVFLCFLIFLYRSFPIVFSFLVSASPVLVCTAVLLGTLLSFGQPNIPEIEREERATHQSVSLQTGSSENVTIVEEKTSYNVGRYSEKERDEVAQLIEQPNLSSSCGSLREHSFNNTVSVTEERSRDNRLENGTVWEPGIDVGILTSKPNNEWIAERLSDREAKENMYADIQKMNDDEHIESDDEKSDADSFDSERVNVDSLDSPPNSPWKCVDDREEKREEEEEDDDDDALESGSDGAESSSPDASMADIMPMLDELHPLLDEEAPLPVHMPNDDSDAASELSSKSSISSHDKGSENNEELEAADEDNEDGENEENEQGNKNELTNSAITWTEEDQKNLMDLGSSEIERNQRLENLILRRRSRKNMSMVDERNLIDLESFDIGFNIAPISTARQNPFDLPRDSYDNMGLPPIPGSAPSILLPRRNPFDIPYDSSEEKPNLMGDGFKEEFATFQSREPFFRRHESFNVGPSIFAPTRKEKQAVKMRPYFVPEQMASEQLSYSRFQRQSSELSDLKASSVPETESISSVEDLEGRMVSEDDNAESILEMNDSIGEGPSDNLELITERVEIPGEYTPVEFEIDHVHHVSENVGHGSQSSEEDGSIVLGFNEKRHVEFEEFQFQKEGTKDHYEERSGVEPLDAHLAGNHLYSEAIEQRHNGRGSSSSSLSEVSERMYNETDGEQMLILEGEINGIVEEPGISSQTSLQSTNLTITFVERNPPWEPVYDSSPPADGNNLSSSSLSSDVNVESDLGLPIVLAKQTMTSVEKESEESSCENDDIHSGIEILRDSSNLYPVNERESGHIAVVDKLEPDNITSTFSRVDGNSGSSIDASMGQKILNHHIQSQDPSSSSDEYFNGTIKSCEDRNLGQSDVQKHVLICVKECPAQVNVPSLEGELTTNHSTEKEETIESPNSDNDIYHKACQKLISAPSAGMHVLHFHDKSDHRQIHEHPNEVQVPNTPVDSFLERKTIDNLSSQDFQELHHHISQNENSPLPSPDFISTQSSDSVATSPHVVLQTVVEEDDEIKDIDEELLSELDSIGDFSVQQQGVTSNELEKLTDSVKEGLPSAQIAESNTTSVVKSEDHILHSVGSVESQGTSSEYSELHVGDVPIVDRVNKENFTAENIPTVKDIETVDAEKQDDKGEEHKDFHSTKSGKGKDKISKSSNSSSSSSSSSDSSSSDSGKE